LLDRGRFRIRLRIPALINNLILSGPDVSGSRPVLVTFEQFKDREDVFRKESKLKGTNIHIRSAPQAKIVVKVPNLVSNFGDP
jgi:hypothetical protein